MGPLASWQSGGGGQIGECSGEERRIMQISSISHVCPSG